MNKIYGLFFVGCVALVWLLVDLPPRRAYAPDDPAFVARLADEDAKPVMTAQYDAVQDRFHIAWQVRPEGQVDVWLITQAQAMSLGALPKAETAFVGVPPDLEETLKGAVLELRKGDEGAVIASGALTAP